MDVRIPIYGLVLFYYFIQISKVDVTKAKNSLATFSCVLLCLQSGLRHIVVGPDTPGYYENFRMIANSNWEDVVSALFVSADEFRDPAYEIVVKAFNTIIPSWQLFLIALGILFFYGLRKVLTRYVETPEGVLFSITLYMSLFSIIALSGIRQQITMALSMIMIPLVEDKKWNIVLPIVLAGALIHISFLFYLAFIPLQMIKRVNMRLLMFVSILLIPVVATSARSIVGFMASQIENDYYMGYTNSVSEIKPYTYVVLCSIISVFLLAGNKYLKIAPQFFSSALILMTVTVPLIMLDGSMIRIGQYFTIYMMVSLPYVIERMYGKQMYLILVLILCFMSFRQPVIYHFCWETIPERIYNPWGIG